MFKRFQVEVLIGSSLFFYAWHYWELTFLLVLSVLFNTLISHFLIHKPSKKKLIAIVGVSGNLGVLATFKYAGLIGVTFFPSGDFVTWLTYIPLPIGISFYTFQGISMVVDVFRGNNEVLNVMKTHSKRNIFLYISFFPQLIAGPIVKAHDFLPQINQKSFRHINFEKAFHYLVVGYFFKMVVADNLKDFTFWMEFPYFQGKSTLTLITYLLAYSAQIFSDFEGYSLIALGIALLFGYQLPLNFNFPYIANSFSDFWRRWHISLSSFLKEYLYIPLGGNKKGRARTYFNLLITMVLGGLWHGAAWSYAVWGLIHGIALAIERLLKDWNSELITRIHKSIFYTFFVQLIVMLAWLTFKLPEFSHVLLYLDSIASNLWMFDNYKEIGIITIYISPVIIYHSLAKLNEKAYYNLGTNLRVLMYGFLLFLIAVNTGSSGQFIYFQF